MSDIEKILKENLAKKNPYQKPTTPYSERARNATENMAKRLKDFAERNGSEVTYEKARKEAEVIINRVDRRRTEG